MLLLFRKVTGGWPLDAPLDISDPFKKHSVKRFCSPPCWVCFPRGFVFQPLLNSEPHPEVLRGLLRPGRDLQGSLTTLSGLPSISYWPLVACFSVWARRREHRKDQILSRSIVIETEMIFFHCWWVYWFFFSVNWFVLANKLWEMTKDATQWRRNIQIYLVYCHQGVKKLENTHAEEAWFRVWLSMR